MERIVYNLERSVPYPLLCVICVVCSYVWIPFVCSYLFCAVFYVLLLCFYVVCLTKRIKEGIILRSFKTSQFYLSFFLLSFSLSFFSLSLHIYLDSFNSNNCLSLSSLCLFLLLFSSSLCSLSVVYASVYLSTCPVCGVPPGLIAAMKRCKLPFLLSFLFFSFCLSGCLLVYVSVYVHMCRCT